MVSCRIMNFNDVRLRDILQDVSVLQDPLVYSFRIYFFPAGIHFILKRLLHWNKTEINWNKTNLFQFYFRRSYLWNKTEIKHWNNSDLFQSCFGLIIIFIRMLRNMQMQKLF